MESQLQVKKLNMNGLVQPLSVTSLFAYDAVLLAQCESKLQKVVDEFKVKKEILNAAISRVMFPDSIKMKVIDFTVPYNVYVIRSSISLERRWRW